MPENKNNDNELDDKSIIDSTDKSVIKRNYETILEIIKDKAILVAASKTFSSDKIEQAYDLGIRDFAESKVQEAEEKIPELREKLKKARFHMIGHLQSNKVKKAVDLFDVIQSVDSLNLAELIGKESEEKGKITDIFLEVNIGMEPQKFGVNPHEALDIMKQIMTIRGIKIKGIMTVPPVVDEERTREYFKQMRQLFKKAKELSEDVEFLSMGMSDDFIIATEEGSNMVRIGRALFGNRIEKDNDKKNNSKKDNGEKFSE